MVKGKGNYEKISEDTRKSTGELEEVVSNW